ncbi:MAG: hypothetical protein ACOVN2_07230, partial [Usitatibacteraceae bacterium]
LAERPLPVAGLETNPATLVDILERAARLRSAVRLGGRGADVAQRVTQCVAAALATRNEGDAIWQAGSKLIAARQGFEDARKRFAEAAGRTVTIDETPDALASLSATLTGLAEARHLLRDWTTWCRTRNRALAAGLGALIKHIEHGVTPPNKACAAFRLGYARWWLPPVLDGDPVLRDFRRFQHENAITEFREIDDLVRTHATGRVIGAIAHGLPTVQSVPRNSELGLLRYQMELQRPSQSIRDMIGKMPESFSKLAPCMLMSPLSIAQYFPPNQALFDVVIFDEASQ